MPKRYPPFTYIPIGIAPIDCPQCGAKAHLIECAPLPADLKGEMRTFQCKDCGKQTKMVVRD